MAEKDIRQEAIRRLRLEGCIAYTQHGSAYSGRGRTDICACCDGIYFGIETKTKTGKARVRQEHTIKTIRAAGGCAFIGRSVAVIMAAVELRRKGITPYMENVLDLEGLPTFDIPAEAIASADEAVESRTPTTPAPAKRTRRTKAQIEADAESARVPDPNVVGTAIITPGVPPHEATVADAGEILGPAYGLGQDPSVEQQTLNIVRLDYEATKQLLVRFDEIRDLLQIICNVLETRLKAPPPLV